MVTYRLHNIVSVSWLVISEIWSVELLYRSTTVFATILFNMKNFPLTCALLCVMNEPLCRVMFFN